MNLIYPLNQKNFNQLKTIHFSIANKRYFFIQLIQFIVRLVISN